ncbi:hypothetical protein GWK47_020345 [Chionoecetes opilio]|uniref:Uncharacterized protein n=1 Tax=Chionoecetes opilio TaxID=41210 RepID=A0A8J5CKW8_CHIOP|nr:hypothetical protein GWK47_020345 [Chionoecetes opilio]
MCDKCKCLRTAFAKVFPQTQICPQIPNFEHDSYAPTRTVQGTLLAHQWLFLFDQMDFLMTTAIHPFFKLPVVRLLNPEKVDAVKSRLLFEVMEKAVLDTSEGSSPGKKKRMIFSSTVLYHKMNTVQYRTVLYTVAGQRV